MKICSACGESKHFNTKSTGAQGTLKPQSVIPREEGGLIHPTPEVLQIEVLISRGASVLLVINTLILPNSSCICLNTPSLYTS